MFYAYEYYAGYVLFYVWLWHCIYKYAEPKVLNQETLVLSDIWICFSLCVGDTSHLGSFLVMLYETISTQFYLFQSNLGTHPSN